MGWMDLGTLALDVLGGRQLRQDQAAALAEQQDLHRNTGRNQRILNRLVRDSHLRRYEDEQAARDALIDRDNADSLLSRMTAANNQYAQDMASRERRLMGDMREAGAHTRQGYRDLRRDTMSGWDQMAAQVNQGYQDRYDRNMGYLEGAGAQERRDIMRDFSSAEASQRAQLAASGLGGTTIGGSMSAGMQRNRRDALGGLNERLRTQRINTDAALSADALSTQANLARARADLDTALATNGLSYDERFANNLASFGSTLSADTLNAQRAGSQQALAFEAGVRDAGIARMGQFNSERTNLQYTLNRDEYDHAMATPIYMPTSNWMLDASGALGKYQATRQSAGGGGGGGVDKGSAAAAGAASGAMAGAAGGPVGMVIGGIAGGAMGYFGADSAGAGQMGAGIGQAAGSSWSPSQPAYNLARQSPTIGPNTVVRAA